jgi:MAE_28990/MAE_18760-like HEPN
MKPPRTADQLQEKLDEDFAWRIQEIAAIRKSIHNASGRGQLALLRAAVPLLYAHWEGFIKKAAFHYSDYISSIGITYREAKMCLAGLKALTYVKKLHPMTKRIFVASELLAALHKIENEAIDINLKPYISNVGNLTYDIFEQIVGFLCIDPTGYGAKKQLIDESLLSRRNDIAHGDYLLIDVDGFESLSEEIIVIMRQFKTDIENGAALKTYLRTAQAI